MRTLDANVPIVERPGTITGEICHIKARNPGGQRFDPTQSEEDRHNFNNLILLCRHHHKVIDSESDIYTVDALTEMKSIHEKVAGRNEKPEDGFFAKILLNGYGKTSILNNSGNVAINSPGAMQAHTIITKTTKKNIVLTPPIGTIGADQEASRYVQYLINRYNEFASSDTTRTTKFSFGAISRNIENNFGSKWKLLPLKKSKFVYQYLQERISKTRLAKNNKLKGHSSFSTFEEFTNKHK